MNRKMLPILAAISLSGCASAPTTVAATGIGVGVGAGVAAVSGARVVTGAVIGGTIGLVGGVLIHHHHYCWREDDSGREYKVRC